MLLLNVFWGSFFKFLFLIYSQHLWNCIALNFLFKKNYMRDIPEWPHQSCHPNLNHFTNVKWKERWEGDGITLHFFPVYRWGCGPFYQQPDSTLHQSVLCQLSLLFPLESLKLSINGSKLVLYLSLLFSKVCCFNFLYKAGLPSINVWLITWYPNLTSTYPLLGFLKNLEWLEVGFREVVRGLVSPTLFMEGCDTFSF